MSATNLFVSGAAAAENYYVGHYKLQSSQNFDELLKTLGYGVLKRQIAASVKPEIIITKNSTKKNSYTVQTLTGIMGIQSSYSFNNGERFIQQRADGSSTPTLILIDDDTKRWTQQQFTKPKLDMVWDFGEDPSAMKVTSTANGVSSIRVYKRV